MFVVSITAEVAVFREVRAKQRMMQSPQKLSVRWPQEVYYPQKHKGVVNRKSQHIHTSVSKLK